MSQVVFIEHSSTSAQDYTLPFSLFFLNLILSYLLEQFTPSPTKPGLHVQIKPANVSVQLAFTWQLLDNVELHSLTAERKK